MPVLTVKRHLRKLNSSYTNPSEDLISFLAVDVGPWKGDLKVESLQQKNDINGTNGTDYEMVVSTGRATSLQL